MRIRWRDLSVETRRRLRQLGVINGCGGKGSWIPVPDFTFTACCDHHDFNYWIGGDETARARADAQFYAAMLVDASLAPSRLRRIWRRGLAWIYYRAVRAFGAKFFHYGMPRGHAELAQVLAGGVLP